MQAALTVCCARFHALIRPDFNFLIVAPLEKAAYASGAFQCCEVELPLPCFLVLYTVPAEKALPLVGATTTLFVRAIT
jgi:hypothetical protein